MNFNIDEKELPIVIMCNFEEAKLDMDYPLQDNDKCNTHLLNISQLESKELKKKKQRTKKSLEPGQVAGHWTEQQKKRYHWFLEIHHVHFENKQLRRMDKIFKSMATFIGTRAADQCRSHHQKMEKKYKTFYNILYNRRLNYYSTVQISPMVEQIAEYGIVFKNALIEQLPTDFSFYQTKKEGGNVKEEERVQDIHYNFFEEREYNFAEIVFGGMTP